MTNYNIPNDQFSIPEFQRLPREIYFPFGFSDGVCPWFGKLEDFLRKWSPRSYEGYYSLAGLFLLSSVANGRVEFEFGGRQSTNLYCLLVGTTTLYAKTTLMKIVKKMITALGFAHLLPDTITAQKMLSMMSLKLPENFERVDSRRKARILSVLRYSGQRCWISNEFGSVIEDIMRPNSINGIMRGILRGFDDHEDLFENGTITRDIESVEKPYLSILGGCTPRDLAGYTRKGSMLWGDGFLARFVLVSPTCKDPKKGRFPNEVFVIPNEILDPLRIWNERLGIPEIVLTPELHVIPAKGELLRIDKETVDAFYQYHDSLSDLVSDNDNEDLAGNYGRFANKALRYAVLFASLDGLSNVSLKYWAKAQNLAEEQRESLHYLYYQLTAGQYKKAMSIEEKILDTLKRDGEINQRDFLQKTHLTVDKVEPVFNRLLDSGIICQQQIGRKIIHVFSEPKCVEV